MFLWRQDLLSFRERCGSPITTREGLLRLPTSATVRKRARPYEAVLLSELLPVYIAQPINENAPTLADHDNRGPGVSYTGTLS